MRETTPPARGDGTTTSDWIKGLVVVALTVGVTIVLPLLLLYAVSTCGCTTRPA